MYSLHKIPVSIFYLFLFSSASGNDPFQIKAGAAEAGMNYSCIIKPGFWSSFHNQALLPLAATFSAGIDYSNRFCISELGTRTAGVVLPAGKACFGAIYSHFGYADFTRHSAGIACGLKLGEKISAGIQTDLFIERTSGELTEREAVTFEAGLLLRPEENIFIGLHLFNPLPSSLRKLFMPSVLRVGAGIRLNRSIFLGSEAEMSSGNRFGLKTGFEYEPVSSFKVRAGFSTINTSFSFGIGYRIKSVEIDLGFTTHERLGISSSASIIFKRNNTDRETLFR